MADVSLYHHMKRAHRIVMPHTQGVDIGGGGLKKNVVYLPRVMNLVACLVNMCPEKVNNLGSLREHFMYWHWSLKMVIPKGRNRTTATIL